MELSPVLRRIRDFYFKEALGAPPEATHVHRPNLVPDQRLFSLEQLRRHLNNPLLGVSYLNVFQAGKPVDLSDARLYKVVQRRKIEFIDHRILQHHLAQGAACVLEGLDILEPQVNELAAVLDRAHTATFANATAFFSQHGNEAYRGHVDTDDVLVVHVAGEKRWRLHRRQPPRRINLGEMTDAQMGAPEAEVVLRPGDVFYLDRKSVDELFLENQLDAIGDGLKKAKRPGPVGAEAGLQQGRHLALGIRHIGEAGEQHEAVDDRLNRPLRQKAPINRHARPLSERSG